MNRVPREIEKRALEMYFLGYTRDHTAETLNIPTGTVSGIWSILPATVEPLRSLSIELRKHNRTVQETVQADTLMEDLKTLGAKPEQYPVYLQAIKKTCEEANYQPDQVVKATVRLLELEAQSGKTYPETLKQFEKLNLHTQDLKNQNKTLKQQNAQLLNEIGKNTQLRKQEIEKANTAPAEIAELNEIKTALRQYGISLTDPANLRKYLDTMKETGYDPRLFVSFTKKTGSIKLHISQLAAEEQARRESLKIITQDIESEATKLDQLLNDHQTLMIRTRNENQTILKAKSQENEGLVRKKAEVAAAEIQLSNLNNAHAEAERKRQETIKDTERTLCIKNYAIEQQRAIVELEAKRSLLEEETNAQICKIAFATVITDFLTSQSDFFFDSFYAEVQRIKKIRENPNSPLKPVLQDLTDAVRSKALGAIIGNPRFTNILTNAITLRPQDITAPSQVSWRFRANYSEQTSSC